MAYDTFTLTGAFLDLDGAPDVGWLRIAATTLLTDPDTGAVLSAPMDVKLDRAGQLEETLPAAGGGLPAFQYRVTLYLNGAHERQFTFDAPAGGATVALGDVIPPSGEPPTEWEQFAADMQTLSGSLVSKTRLPVNVKDYGAVGDGATVADGAAIIAALATGRPTYVPPGTYLAPKAAAGAYALSLAAGARLFGEGTIKLANSTAVSTSVIHIAGDDVEIQGIRIDGNKANQSVEAQKQRHGIYSNRQRVRIRDVHITGTAGDGILLWDGSKDVRIANVRTDSSCERNGITLYGNTAATAAVEDVSIIGCHLECGVQPIDMEPTAGYIKDVRILGNYLKGPSGANYAITLAGPTTGSDRSDGLLVQGNTLYGALYLLATKNVKVVGNLIDARGSAENAVWNLHTSDDVLLSGNTILAAPNVHAVRTALSGANRPTGWKMVDNLIVSSGTGRGVSVEGTGPVTIRGNTIKGSGGDATTQGLYCQATGDMESVIVDGNTVEGYGTALYFAPFSTFSFKKLAVTNNTVDDTSGAGIATYGIRFAGTVAQFGQPFVSGNQVAPVYTVAEDLLTVPVRIGGGGTRPVFVGTGTPEAVISAAIGAMFLRRDGGTTTTLYIKTSGTGNTGWTAK